MIELRRFKGNWIAASVVEVVSMKRMSVLAMLLALTGTPAMAGDPSGDWLVEDGTAKIRIAICDGSLWGVIGWEKVPGGKDTENPDPAKRSRDTLGMPILIDMKPSGADKWSGQIYNARDGKMYKASVELQQSEQALKVRGCVLGGLFCGGETWVRSADAFPAPVGPDAPKSKSKKTKGTAPAADKGGGASGFSGNVCASVGDVARPSH
jgi:uncharacterized protein (DUF2147 family)